MFDSLRHTCEAYLCKHISKDNVCGLFSLAEDCGSLFLREETFDYLATHHVTVVKKADSGWMALSPELRKEVEDFIQRKKAKQTKVKTTVPFDSTLN